MENIFTVAKPFLTFAKFLGIFPMSFEGPARKGFLKVHWEDLILSAVCIALSVFSFLVSMASNNFFGGFVESKISSQGWNVTLKLSNITMLWLLFYQFWKRKNIVEFLNLIQNFDMLVRIEDFSSQQSKFSGSVFQAQDFNIRSNHKKHRKFVYFAIAFNISSIIFIVVYTKTISNSRKIEDLELLMFDFCFATFCCSIYMAQFILVSAALTSRFQALNECIQSSLQSLHIKIVRSNCSNSDKLAKLFDKLCDGIGLVNETFTFQFTLLFTSSLVSSLQSIADLIDLLFCRFRRFYLSLMSFALP
jgi:hypothetical protein